MSNKEVVSLEGVAKSDSSALFEDSREGVESVRGLHRLQGRLYMSNKWCILFEDSRKGVEPRLRRGSIVYFVRGEIVEDC